MPLTVISDQAGPLRLSGAVVMADLPEGVTVQQPSGGVLKILGALAALPSAPSGTTIAQPTSGTIPILGAYVIGYIDGGEYVQGIPS